MAALFCVQLIQPMMMWVASRVLPAACAVALPSAMVTRIEGGRHQRRIDQIMAIEAGEDLG